MSGYLPVVIYLALIIAFGVVSLGMAMILRPSRPYATKLDNYEFGAETIGQAWVQFPVGFYLVALIFIVFDATTPGRCAAPPAPAMMTLRPRSSAPAAHSRSASGVRCAESTRTSKGTAKDSRVSAA